MTSRDFRLIASIIHKYFDESDAGKRHNMAREFADYLATTNPRFDRARFIAAATGEPLRNGDRPRERDYR